MLDRDALCANGHEVRHLVRARERVGHVPEVARLAHGHEVVLVHARASRVAVLVGGEGEHRIGDGEAADHERAAARHAEDCHREAALVAEEVAGAYLAEERQAAPYGRDALKQDARAGARSLGTHERGGLFGKLASHGERRGDADAHHEHPDGERAKRRVEAELELRQGVHDAEDREQELRQGDEAQERSQTASHQRCECGIGHVLGHDGASPVAERLVEADEPALLLHHACGRGERHEDGHREEDGREDCADDLDGACVGVDGGVAGDGGAVLDVPDGVLDRSRVCPRVGDLGEGVCLLAFVVGEVCVESGLAVVGLGLGGVELGRAVGELTFGELAAGVELGLPLDKLGAALLEL